MSRFVFVAVAFVAAPTLAAGEEYLLRTFEKRHLEPKFYSEGAAVGDFNHDGVQDVASGPYWYQGPDYKTRHEIYPPKPFPKEQYSDNFFSWGRDVNGDGWDDVVVVGFPGLDASWFQNPKGSGSWKRHKVVDVVDNESPHYADLTGDGVPEIVCSQKGQYGYASPDPADPTKPWKFVPISERADYQRFTHGLGIGDVNGDGRNDLLAKDGWWEQPINPSRGQLWKKHPFNFSGPGGAQMYAYDFDGDGDADVLTSLAAHAYGLVWYENVGKDGAIDFKPRMIMGDKPAQNDHGLVFSQLHAIDLSDMDGDGVKDVVLGKRHWAHGSKGDPEPTAPAVLYWFKTVRGKDGVSFVPYMIDDDSGVGTQVLATDMNGDKLPDVVVGNKLGTFVHLQRLKSVSKEEWEKARPKLKGTKPTAAVDPSKAAAQKKTP